MRSNSARTLACLLIAVAFLVPVGALTVGAGPSAEKEWTILVFWACDNNLEFTTEFCMQTWEKSLTSNAEVNIVVFIDILTVDGTSIYEIKDGSRTLVDTWAEMNSSDPAVLKQFTLWGMDHYPAKKTLLLISDHGYGWRGICQDETNGDVLMPIAGIADVLKEVKAANGKGVDLLAFDACNMMTIEVAYELRGAVPYVVGSETTEPYDGLPYEMFITALVKNPAMSPKALATEIVTDYTVYYSDKRTYSHQMKYSQDFATCSAVDTSMMDDLGAAFQDFANALRPLIADHRKQVENARGYALVGTWTNMAGYEWMPDVYTFVDGLKIITDHPELTSAIVAFERAFDSAIFAESHSRKYHDTVHGLNFWFPGSLSQYHMQGWAWARQFVYEDSGLDLVDGNSPWVQCLMAYYGA